MAQGYSCDRSSGRARPRLPKPKRSARSHRSLRPASGNSSCRSPHEKARHRLCARRRRARLPRGRARPGREPSRNRRCQQGARHGAAAGGSVAANRRSQERTGAGLPAAGQHVGRQSDRLPQRARDQAPGRQGGGVRRDLRQRPHPGRQGRPHRRLRGHEDHEDRLSDAAEPRRRIHRRAADGVREDDPHNLARPAHRVARARGRQATRRRSAEQSAAGDRQ